LKKSKQPKEDLSKQLKITMEDAAVIMRFTLNSLSRLSLTDLHEKKKNLIQQLKETDLIIKNPSPTVKKEIDLIQL
jgi:DNA gyrase/topoisomerase IV subunit A